MNTVVAFPNWKKDASAAERLDELAGLAREYPGRFERFVIVYKETMPGGRLKYRSLEYNCDLDQQIGMFELGKLDAYRKAEE
jgi:hypothetical protein